MRKKMLFLWFLSFTVFDSVLIGRELGAIQANATLGVPYQPFTLLLLVKIIALIFWVSILYYLCFTKKK
jgi:hypothetical protein